MALLIARHRPNLDRAAQLAAATHVRLEFLFPILDALCGATCPGCRVPCCRQATVTFDHSDLIFLHLIDQDVPPRQPRPSPGPPCRYIGLRGCVLPRSRRPWICTWYLCPSQKNLLDRDTRRSVGGVITEIKRLRKEMEDTFIRAVI